MKLKYFTPIAISVLFSSQSFCQYIKANEPPPSSQPPGELSPVIKPTVIKKNIITFGFFSPLNHHISFGYDRLLGEDIVLTTQTGIIGPGVTQTDDKSVGGFLEAGMKLFFKPDFVVDGMRRYNAMQGGYFKPQIIFAAFSSPYTYNYYNNYYQNNSVTTSNTYTGLALLLNFGKQWVIQRSFVLDMYVGVGYNLINPKPNTYSNGYGYSYSEPYPSNFYSFITTGASFPLAFAGGINMGVPF